MDKLRGFFTWIVLPALVIGGALRMFLFEPWTIPAVEACKPDDNDCKSAAQWMSASVAPSLAGGDLVLMYTRGTPTQGDLVRCTDPEDPKSFVVGRVVGMPGDTVELQGNRLKVNRNDYNSTDACEDTNYELISPVTHGKVNLMCGRVEMGGSWHYMGRLPKASTESPRKFNVQTGRVFLVSDDRDFHLDSRDFGAVPIETCNRKIVFRLWSAAGWGDSKHRMSAIH